MSELNLNEPTDLSKISKADLKKDDIDVKLSFRN